MYNCCCFQLILMINNMIIPYNSVRIVIYNDCIVNSLYINAQADNQVDYIAQAVFRLLLQSESLITVVRYTYLISC